MRQQRVTKRPRRVADKRRTTRKDEPQEDKREIREDLRHWFEEN